MKITEITLHNWCQYEGDHVFEFGLHPERNVILVHADNDVGKSSLFYSIAWCLHEQQPEKWVNNKWPLYPLPWFHRARQGDRIKTEVAVTFEHQTTMYCARRSFVTHKTTDDGVIVDQSFVLLRQAPGGNWEQTSIERLNRIFPKSVLGYFIFDAEKIEHFVNQNESVQQSVRRLLNIEDAERAVFHLQKVAADLNRQVKAKSASKAEEYKDNIAKTTKLLNELRDDLDDPNRGLKAKLQLCREEKKLVEEQLFQFKDVHALLEEERQTEQAIGSTKVEIKDTLKKLRGTTQTLYIAMAYPAVRKAFQILEDKRIRGELPKHIKRTFVVDRIDIGKCICGTSLVPGTDAYKEVTAFRDSLSDELSDTTQNLNNNLVALMERARGLRPLLQTHTSRLSDLKKKQQDLEESLRVTRSKIQTRNDIPDVPQLQLKKENLENQEAAYIRSMAAVEAELDNKIRFVEQLNGLLRAELKVEERSNAATQDWILATTAEEALTKAIDKFKSKARKYLEDQCNIVGRELFWREDVYRIHISSDYVISVTSPTTGDKNLLAGMSMGVTQMTGLALIAALARQTQAQAPLIMDTPFARLGPAHITRALSECPNHFRQWLLFLQPSEWKDSDYRPVLASKIQKEFTLKRDNVSGITTALTGYRPECFGKTRK